MRAAVVVCLMLAVWGCNSGERKVTEGVVTRVTGSTPTVIERFWLRTANGEELQFAMGRLELDRGSFNAGHLREHQALAATVRVTYVIEGTGNVAVRLDDAE